MPLKSIRQLFPCVTTLGEGYKRLYAMLDAEAQAMGSLDRGYEEHVVTA